MRVWGLGGEELGAQGLVVAEWCTSAEPAASSTVVAMSRETRAVPGVLAGTTALRCEVPATPSLNGFVKSQLEWAKTFDCVVKIVHIF